MLDYRIKSRAHRSMKSVMFMGLWIRGFLDSKGPSSSPAHHAPGLSDPWILGPVDSIHESVRSKNRSVRSFQWSTSPAGPPIHRSVSSGVRQFWVSG
jgi:hypothetical protein